MDKTGFYEVYTSQGNYAVAVNPDPRESDLAVIEGATLQRWLDAMGGPGAAGDGPDFELAAEPVELWHTLLLILALVLIAESALANVHLAPRTGGELNG